MEAISSSGEDSYPNISQVPVLPPGAAVHPAFVEACMARIAEDVERQGWRLGKSIVTRSKECGLVWRIDFEIEGSRYGGNLADRVICWRSPDSENIGLAMVFGKRIDKLA
jgi:hypothetical protein